MNKRVHKTVKKDANYPEGTDSVEMARVAREALNKMSDEEVEHHFEAAVARIYGGRSAQQAPRG